MEQESLERKRLVVDYLVKMYLEQNSNGMHREGQRTTATTIFTTFATALLALIASRWKPGVPFDESFLPLTVGLCILSSAGAFLVMKIFESSQVNFTLADAYRHTADLILSDDARKLTEGRVTEIKYVFRALDYLGSEGSRPLYTITFNGNKKVKVPMPEERYREVIANHNPIDPREVVVPKYNAVATWLGIKWVQYDTHKTWTIIPFIYFFLGLALSIVALA